MKIVAGTGAVLGLIAATIAVFWFVLPAFKERRIRSFCDSVTIGENAEALWNRGSSFDRERSEATHIALKEGESDNMDFSVRLPSLFMSVWHCNVSVDKNGQVSSKVLGRED